MGKPDNIPKRWQRVVPHVRVVALGGCLVWFAITPSPEPVVTALVILVDVITG